MDKCTHIVIPQDFTEKFHGKCEECQAEVIIDENGFTCSENVLSFSLLNIGVNNERQI
jgi:hypothetical protein